MSKRKRFKEYLEDYFNLRRFERYGLASVLVLSIIFIALRIPKYDQDINEDLSKFIEISDSNNDAEEVSDSEINESNTSYSLQPFNPNTVIKETLYEMGLPPSVVKSIINFRASGFEYRKPEDLLKCYGVDQQLFDELAPYVVIINTKEVKKRVDIYDDGNIEQRAMQPFEFDPNTVSREELKSMNLPDNFITGFLNFRNAGAKFYSMADVEKVYSLTDDVQQVIAPYLRFPVKPTFSKKAQQERTPEVHRFRFDPNRISRDSLLLLGVPESAANIWVNYRNSGKKYYSLEDLRSIYNLTESKIQELVDWMDFPIIMVAEPKTKIWPQQPSLNIDPNSTSLEELMEIKGIGRYYANAILWRRKRLGGFYSVDQIGEAENIPDSIFQAVKYHFVSPTLDSLKSINVNTTRRRAFADHPYITYEAVNRIITHREFVGPKLNLEYLKKLELLSSEEARLLAPYLTFE